MAIASRLAPQAFYFGWMEHYARFLIYLTLLALGSSAPEICLALINTLSTLDADQPGQLGAATIVGSASFNLLVVTAVCIVAPPPGELRRVSSIRVFMCTASASVLAFVSPATTFCLDQRAVV